MVTAPLALSGVMGQFWIKLFSKKPVKSFSEGRPIFLYNARALFAPSLSAEVYRVLLSATVLRNK